MENIVDNLDLIKIKTRLREKKSTVYGFAELIHYAILLPLIEINGKLSVLFQVRAHHLRRQPGEIAFPGGKVEPDDIDEAFAAVRETCEEMGVEPHQVEILEDLGILIPPFQIALHTYVGKITSPEKMQINADEVAEVFTVPLDFLINTPPSIHYLQLGLTPGEDFPYESIPGGKDYKFRGRQIPEYFYFYEDRVIWGLTARILNHFLGKIC